MRMLLMMLLPAFPPILSLRFPMRNFLPPPLALLDWWEVVRQGGAQLVEAARAVRLDGVEVDQRLPQVLLPSLHAAFLRVDSPRSVTTTTTTITYCSSTRQRQAEEAHELRHRPRDVRLQLLVGDGHHRRGLVAPVFGVTEGI